MSSAITGGLADARLGASPTSPAAGPGAGAVLAVAFVEGGPAVTVLSLPTPPGSGGPVPAAWSGLPAGAPVALVARVDGARLRGGQGPTAVHRSPSPASPAAQPTAADAGGGAGADAGVGVGVGAGASQVRRQADVLVPSGDDLVAAELRRRGVAVGVLLSDGEAAGLATTLRSVADGLVGRATIGAVVVADGADWSSMTPEEAWATVPAAVRHTLEDWGRALAGHRRVLLAAPRSFCAGVERAIEIVERALERFGAPVYVRRQIVHNSHVVHDLEQRGAVFVQELDEVPEGATVVLAAHGVAPAVRHQAEDRGLTVIDATCPLVAKVHREARRFAGDGRTIVLIGHRDHEEVEGTVGEAPGRVHVVADVADVAALPLGADDPVAYLTQTTLALDETAEVVAAVRARFTDVVGPAADDICYATQNRQDAVRAMAPHCDLVLVVGSPNSSNTLRLVEMARRHGRRAELIEDRSALQLSWLAGVRSVGVTAGASAPESVVRGVVDALDALGTVSVSEHRTTDETVHFSLPPQVR